MFNKTEKHGRMAESCIFTLPKSLCIKHSGSQKKGYEVWSVEDIPAKTRFGPYKGTLVEGSNELQNTGYQWKVQTKERLMLTLDGSNEKESTWLRYVNCASNKKKQNLIVIQNHSCVYFETCKAVTAKNQLLVWYKEGSSQKEHNSHDLEKTQNIIHFPETKRIEQEMKMEHHVLSDNTSNQPKIITPHLTLCYPSLFILTPTNAPQPSSIQNIKLVTTNTTASTLSGNTSEIMQKLYECKISNRSYTAMNLLQEHKRDHITKIPYYECNVCQKRYKSNYNLKIHKRDHTGERPYECNICKKHFKSINLLHAHQVTHRTDRPFECEICQKRFKTAVMLKKHKLRHTGEKPFGCKVCNKRFYEKTHLNVHNRIHTGEKPFECDVCHKKFRESFFLTVHRRLHTGEKPYECQTCHRRFRVRNSLRGHERIHTGEKPFECKICHKRFRFHSPLHAHMKVHAEKKSYQCEVCHDMFTKKNVVKGCCKKLPFKCSVCNKKYIRYDVFLKHKITHQENSTVNVSAAELVETT